MNVLYVVQQSIYDKNGKWRSADSNIFIMQHIISELIKKTDWEFYILIGDINDFGDITSYDQLIPKHKQVHFIPYNFPVDAFLNRQHFNINDFCFVVDRLPKIDVVWNNITELTRNIKTLFNVKYSQYPLFISCCYWLDTMDNNKIDYDISYMWRQFDGFECSDLVVFTCDSCAREFNKNAYYVFDEFFVSKIMEKSVVWDFGYSSGEISKYKPQGLKFNIPTIMFLNRLSGINYTHHIEFIKAIELLHKIRDDFQVMFTNPTEKYSWGYLKANVPNFSTGLNKLNKTKSNILSRGEYIKMLHMGDISVHLFESEMYGGCSHRESIACGNIVITPKINEYLRVQGHEYPFYVDRIIPESLCEKMCLALDSSDFVMSDDILLRNERSCFETNSGIIVDDIETKLKEQGNG